MFSGASKSVQINIYTHTFDTLRYSQIGRGKKEWEKKIHENKRERESERELNKLTKRNEKKRVCVCLYVWKITHVNYPQTQS